MESEHVEIIDIENELAGDYAVLDMDENELADTFPDEYCEPMREDRLP